MSESLEFLLTDEFVEFSQKIADVVSRKKVKQDEIQAIFTKAKVELKQLEDEAKGLMDDWENFKATAGKSKVAKAEEK